MMIESLLRRDSTYPNYVICNLILNQNIKMKLIAGSLVYGMSEYLTHHFGSFLSQSFLPSNLKQISKTEYSLKFQNYDYIVKSEPINSLDCIAISILSNFSNTYKIGDKEFESNIGVGVPKIIREHIITQSHIVEWYDCKMLEPDDFNLIVERIELREIHFRQLRSCLLYTSPSPRDRG